MGDSKSPGLHRMQLESVGKCDGRQFREWKITIREVIILYAPELLPTLDGVGRPTPPASNADAVAAWETANGRLFSLLYLVTAGSAKLTVGKHKDKGARGMGDGAAAWKELNERFDAHTQEARRACHNQLYNLKLTAGGDPVDFFTKGWELKNRLQVFGEEVSDEVYLDVMLNGLTAATEFKFIREMHYRDEFTSVDHLQTTATRFFIDQESRRSSGPAVSGRGAAMAAATSTDQCHQCKGYGHFKRDCPQQQQKNRSKRGSQKTNKSSGGGGGPKWCSLHNTKKHSDAECQKQKELRGLAANLALLQSPGQASSANVGSAHMAQPLQPAMPQPFAQASFPNVGSTHLLQPQPLAQGSFPNVGSTHLVQPPPPEPSTFGFSFHAMGSALAEAAASSSATATPPAASDSAPAGDSSTSSESPDQDHRLPPGVFGAFMATSTDLSDANLRSDGSYIKAVVDSGASDNYLDPALTPGLRNHMSDVEVFRVPHTIVAAGQHLLRGVGVGTVFGTVTDDAGNERPISFRAIMVPGIGTNLFSVGAAMLKGVAVLFYPNRPRLEKDGIVIPMQPLGVDAATGKVMYSVTVKLGISSHVGDHAVGSALKVESVDLWHRRMGHINLRSLALLRKTPGNGVEYTGDLEPCGTCPLGKSTQQPHPKQASYDVLRPFDLVFVDTLGPISPEALGGFNYAVKFVEQQTKWKEIVLMKDKTHTVESLELFNKSTVIPYGGRIGRLRGDQGTELRNAKFRQYCLDVGIKLEFASPNTPQQIGANERAGRTLINMVRCLLADSGLPKFLWGELIQTAAYLSNLSPHAALKDETPHKALYGKDAYLGHLRVIGARAFVHEETYTKKLEHRAWEGRLVGYSMDSKSYRVYNAQTRRVRESRNVIFIETPSAMPPPDACGFDDGEFTYDGHDDMVRDVRNLDSHSLDHAVGDQPVLDLLQRIRETIDRDLGKRPAGSTPTADGASGGDNPASPGGVSPSETGEGTPPSGDAPSGSSPSSSEPSGPAPSGSPPSGAASHGGGSTTSSGGRGSTGGRGSRGGRGSTPVHQTRSVRVSRGGRGSRGSRGERGSTSVHQTRSVTRQPSAATISELKRLSYAYYAKGEFPDIAHNDDFNRFTEYAYAVGITQPNIPQTIQEALASPDGALWDAAAKREIKSLQDHGVYKLVPRSAIPRGRKTIKTKWVMKVKPDNTRKARLVAQGWNQVQGLDCGSTFAPVCRLQSLRMLFAIAAERNLEMQQMDVQTAFLYADIQEEVFVDQPPGFKVKDKDGGDLVWKLEKSLYGLAQSPGNWLNTIDPALIIIGFVPLKSDPCIYIYYHNGVFVILALYYLDDFLLVGEDIEEIEMIMAQLNEKQDD